nr:ubiquitin-conjugating enzyme E2 [Candidatus Njordarchaeum guaymaensis]
MSEDSILAREAQLLYNRAPEFKPVSGDLRRWRGSIPGRGSYRNVNFDVEIIIPFGFPNVPPQVRMVTPTEHPYLDEATGTLRLSIITGWKPEYHLYQVVNTVKGMFAQIPPRPSSRAPVAPTPPRPPQIPFTSQQPYRPSASSPPPQTTSLGFPSKPDEVSKLKQQISTLEEEVAHLRGKITAHNVPEEGPDNLERALLPSDPRQREALDLESEKIALEDLVRSLEEKYEAGDISPTDYTRLYKKYKKQLFLLDKKISETRGV